MPKYRIIKSTGHSSQPSVVWIEKPTDKEAIATARESLGPRDSAEVWGERDLVAHLHGVAPAAAPGRLGRLGRSITHNPLRRHLFAGLITTTGIALVLAALNGRALEPSHSRLAPIASVAVSDAAAAAPVPAQTAVAPVQDSAIEVAESPEAPTPPSTPPARPKAHRAHRVVAEAAAQPKEAGRLFPAGTRPQTNVYTLMASGISQGGN